jgi:hypothetical protein
MTTSFQQRNSMSQPSPTAGPDFASWRQENLVKFAQEAHALMQAQTEQLEQLRQDLKTALEAYRSLLRQK